LDARTRLTSNEYLALPDEFHPGGERIRDELIDGELVQWPFLPLAHSLVVSNITHILQRYITSREDLALEVLAFTGFQVSEYDTFVPDLSVLRKQQLDIEARMIQGPPALPIEVIADWELMMHLHHKVHAYLANGAEKVWVVYPNARSVVVQDCDAIREYKGDEAITEPDLLPDFSSPVSEFFELR